MTKQFITRPTRWVIAPAEDARIFAERGFTVEIDDQGGGEFVLVKEHEDRPEEATIAINSEDWDALCSAIDTAFAEIDIYKEDALPPDFGPTEFQPHETDELVTDESLATWRTARTQIEAWLSFNSGNACANAMANAFLGRWVNPNSYPRNTDDIAACLELLEAAPAVREFLHCLSHVGAAWAEFVERWDEIEAGYRASPMGVGSWDELNGVIQSIGSKDDAMARDFEVRKQVQAWLSQSALSGNIGLSSRAMASAFCLGWANPNDYPRDAGGFGRCVGLLDTAPLARGYMSRVADIGLAWSKFVEEWDELEGLYNAGSLSVLNDRIRNIYK